MTDVRLSVNAARTALSDADGAWRLLCRGAAGAFIVQAGGAALGLGVHAALARLIGGPAYGTYALVLTWISVLSTAALLGQGSGVVRFVARYVYHGQWAELRGLRRGASAIVLGASAVISVCGTGIVYVLRVRFGGDLAHTFYAGFLLLPALTQLQLSGAIHRGLKRAASSGAFNVLLRPVILMLVVAGLAFGFGVRVTAPVAMMASCAGALAALVLSEKYLSGAWPAEAASAPPRHEARAWMALGRQLFFLDVIGIVLNRVDVLILGAFAGAAGVGPYYVATQMSAVASYGLNAVNTILAPMIAERYGANDRDGLMRIVHQAAWLMVGITSFITVAALLFGRWVLGWFGAGFEAAFVPLLILLAGECGKAIAGPAGFLMTMTRLEKHATAVFGGGAAINVVLSLVLVPLLGTTGAALASAAAALSWSAAAVAFIGLELRFNPTILPISVRP